MFDDTLHSSWDRRSRRGLTTLSSFAVEGLVVAVLLIVPLLRPTGLPLLRRLSVPISLTQVSPGPEVRSEVRGSAINSGPHREGEIVLRQPAQIPRHIAVGNEVNAPPVAPFGAYVQGARETADTVGVINSLGVGSAPVIPKPPSSPDRTIRLSHMSEGDLVRKVLPIYPPLARSARIQGAVILQAMIGKSGAIENLRLISGHPMLAPAAIEAVRQWRYRPYVLNGEAVAVETQIIVNFSLAGN
jgi:periplasmic protein TonB